MLSCLQRAPSSYTQSVPSAASNNFKLTSDHSKWMGWKYLWWWEEGISTGKSPIRQAATPAANKSPQAPTIVCANYSLERHLNPVKKADCDCPSSSFFWIRIDSNGWSVTTNKSLIASDKVTFCDFKFNTAPSNLWTINSYPCAINNMNSNPSLSALSSSSTLHLWHKLRR